MRGRVCILGATGLLGHHVLREALAEDLDVIAAGRDERRVAAVGGASARFLRCDLTRDADIEAIARLDVDAVVNCAGLIKPLSADAELAERVNARAPHLLSAACSAGGMRLVHVSTDCVFRGDRGGPYPEDAPPDADDVYGRSKARGEVAGAPHVTLRTSFIGHELGTRYGLLEWFLSQTGTVRGFSRHLWNGLGAPALARVLLRLAIERPDVIGVVHVAGESVDKHSLLLQLAEVYGREDVEVVPDDSTAVDRRLDAHRLTELGLHVPPLREMLAELPAARATLA